MKKVTFFQTLKKRVPFFQFWKKNTFFQFWKKRHFFSVFKKSTLFFSFENVFGFSFEKKYTFFEFWKKVHFFWVLKKSALFFSFENKFTDRKLLLPKGFSSVFPTGRGRLGDRRIQSLFDPFGGFCERSAVLFPSLGDAFLAVFPGISYRFPSEST